MIYSAGWWNVALQPPPSRYQGWMAHSCTRLLPALLHPSGQSTLRAHLQDWPRGDKMRRGKVQWNQSSLFSPYSRFKLVRAGQQIKLLTICEKLSKNKHRGRPEVMPFRHLLRDPLHGSLFYLLALLRGRPAVTTSFQACWQAEPLCQAFLQHFIRGREYGRTEQSTV